MEQGTSIDDILNGTDSEAPAETVIDTPVAEPPPETIGQPRQPNGQFAAKEQTGVEEPQPEQAAEPVPPTEQASGLPREDFAALKDERRKRQTLENELAELRSQFAAMQQRPHQAQEPEPDFWDNPQAVIGRQFETFGKQLRAELRQEQIAERIDASEAAARSKYADYDDAFHAFRQAVQFNPALTQQMLASPDPADFAYKTGKRAIDLERVGSFEELLNAERAKWEQDARAAVTQPPAFPQSTVNERSVGQRAGPAWSGPTPLGDILS